MLGMVKGIVWTRIFESTTNQFKNVMAAPQPKNTPEDCIH